MGLISNRIVCEDAAERHVSKLAFPGLPLDQAQAARRTLKATFSAGFLDGIPDGKENALAYVAEQRAAAFMSRQRFPPDAPPDVIAKASVTLQSFYAEGYVQGYRYGKNMNAALHPDPENR